MEGTWTTHEQKYEWPSGDFSYQNTEVVEAALPEG